MGITAGWQTCIDAGGYVNADGHFMCRCPAWELRITGAGAMAVKHALCAPQAESYRCLGQRAHRVAAAAGRSRVRPSRRGQRQEEGHISWRRRLYSTRRGPSPA
jgi:hypothetical protein